MAIGEILSALPFVGSMFGGGAGRVKTTVTTTTTQGVSFTPTINVISQSPASTVRTEPEPQFYQPTRVTPIEIESETPRTPFQIPFASLLARPIPLTDISYQYPSAGYGAIPSPVQKPEEKYMKYILIGGAIAVAIALFKK